MIFSMWRIRQTGRVRIKKAIFFHKSNFKSIILLVDTINLNTRIDQIKCKKNNFTLTCLNKTKATFQVIEKCPKCIR